MPAPAAGRGRAPDGVPQLVAPVAAADHLVDVEVDVACLARIVHQRKAQRVGAALGDALREVGRLPLHGLRHLLGIQVAACGQQAVPALVKPVARRVEGSQQAADPTLPAQILCSTNTNPQA